MCAGPNFFAMSFKSELVTLLPSCALAEAHFQRMKRFFALPQEVKEHYKHDKTENVGYEQRSQFRPSTGMIDQKESLILRTSKEYGWPSEHDLAGYSSATFKYMEKCHELSMLIRKPRFLSSTVA